GDVDLAAVPLRLVGDLGEQVPHAGIRDGPGEAAEPDHASDVEVLDGDRGVLGDEAVGELVRVVLPDCGDPSVETVEALPCCGVAVGPWLGSRQGLVDAPQSLLRLL